MRFSISTVAVGSLAAVAALTFADMAMSQADLAVDDAAILDAIEATHEADAALSELAIKKGSSQEMKDLANEFLTAHKAGKEEVSKLEEKLDLKKNRQDTPRPPTDTMRPPADTMRPPADTMTPRRDSVMDPTRDTVPSPARDTTAPAPQDTLRLSHDWTGPLDALKKSHDDQKKQLENLEGKAFDRSWVEHQVAFHANALENIQKVTPDASNPEVKALLSATQSSIQTHLQRARELQRKMTTTQ